VLRDILVKAAVRKQYGLLVKDLMKFYTKNIFQINNMSKYTSIMLFIPGSENEVERLKEVK
jgi:hypothetical protein